MKQAASIVLANLACLTGFAAVPPAAPLDLRIVVYVAPNGSTGNDGTTTNSPWPLTYAVSNSGPETVVVLLPGNYPGFGIYRSGIEVRAQSKWAARVLGSTGANAVWTGTNVASVIIDGVEVAGSAQDGISFNGTNCTVRNCWIHDAAGNGISARQQSGTLLERNLIERNGTGAAGGQGISLSGTNCIIRGNVLRYNQSWGCQFYPPPGSSAGCYFYDNLVYGNGSGVTVQAPSGQTNYVFNNTIISPTNSAMLADFGNLCVTNNILLAGGGLPVIAVADNAIVWSDYNLVNAATSPGGPHDTVAADPGFVNRPAGLFWLTAISPARAVANPAVVPPVDFFGQNESSVTDVGAVQYSPVLAGDTRVLDPSPTNGADYWFQLTGGGTAPTITTEPHNQTVTTGQSATFSVVASGTAPLAYQWRKSGTNINGATQSSYALLNCQLSDSGSSFSVTVADVYGLTNSTAATLTVNPLLVGPTYYVSTNGANSGPGTLAQPWSLTYALSRVTASNTLIFLPGTYPTIDLSSPQNHSGTTLIAQTKWAATVVPSPSSYGIVTESGVSNVVIDGFQVCNGLESGVKLNGDYSTVRNCWIYSNYWEGIEAHYKLGTIIEYNLLEGNGVDPLRTGYGVYMSGTNCTVRGNVVRYNDGYGIHIYLNDPGGAARNFQIYNNLIYGNSKAITVWATPGSTNYFFNNTIIGGDVYCVSLVDGVFCATNNILSVSVPSGYSVLYPVETKPAPMILEGYNVVNVPMSPSGPHDIVTSLPGFVSPATGLYWLTAGSPARGAANSTAVEPVDFFGNPESSVTDIGAFQYRSSLESDQRVLDPSGSNGANYWLSF